MNRLPRHFVLDDGEADADGGDPSPVERPGRDDPLRLFVMDPMTEPATVISNALKAHRFLP